MTERGLHWDWIWSSSCFVFPDSQKKLMCFDQCHSGSLDRPAYHRRLPAGLRYDLFVWVCTCVCLCVCVWWQMMGEFHRACRDGADNLYSLSSGRLRLTWTLLHVTHTHCPDTLWDSLVIYLHSQMQIHTQHTHAHTVCKPDGVLKSFSSNLRESLALMLINVRVFAHNGEKREREERQAEKWETMWERYKSDLERWRFGKPEQRSTGQHNVRSENTSMERKKEQVMDIQGVKTANRDFEKHRDMAGNSSKSDHGCMWSYSKVEIWPVASWDLWNFKCRYFPLQQGQLLCTHTHICIRSPAV